MAAEPLQSHRNCNWLSRYTPSKCTGSFKAEGYAKPQPCIDTASPHPHAPPHPQPLGYPEPIPQFGEGAEGQVVGQNNNITFVLRAPGYPLERQEHPTFCVDRTNLNQPSSGECAPPPAVATNSFLLILLTGIISVTFLLWSLQDELGSCLKSYMCPWARSW